MKLRTRHELKTWPEFFQAMVDGRKQFELRRNDRDFQVGDELLLREWGPINYSHEENKSQTFGDGAYTGREALVRVDYVMGSEDTAFVSRGYENVPPLAPGYVIMGVSRVNYEQGQCGQRKEVVSMKKKGGC